MKLFETFQLGAHYENWEFQLENHQDLIIADRFDIIDVSSYQELFGTSKLMKIQLYFNADILVKVKAEYKTNNRESSMIYNYQEYEYI